MWQLSSHIMTAIAKKLLLNGKEILPTVRDARSPKNLYKLLNVYPNNGVGLKVVPDHWVNKGIIDSYYEITKATLKMKDITHGKVFGIKVWNGRVLKNGKPEKIRGGYKWNWMLWPVKESL
ncbi:2053_t:CDS:2 [Scutellospora calospora]|uniref:2053_t:CDS:1 n=1 Tax=Scutellospora calospora TaxID=85575 RepID=A0ACA9K0M2_9GLOM|nr:2053_t:CDS:2 [Scutellospora calospora]